jgi:hypothetical protein
MFFKKVAKKFFGEVAIEKGERRRENGEWEGERRKEKIAPEVHRFRMGIIWVDKYAALSYPLVTRKLTISEFVGSFSSSYMSLKNLSKKYFLLPFLLPSISIREFFRTTVLCAH